jgi:hypothetical protein
MPSMLPHYLRTVRSLAFAASVGSLALGCASTVGPASDADPSDVAVESDPCVCPYGVQPSDGTVPRRTCVEGTPEWTANRCLLAPGGPLPPPEFVV